MQKHIEKLTEKKLRVQALESYYSDLEKSRENKRIWYANNKELIKEQRSTPEFQEYLRTYERNRRENDIEYKIKKNLRSRVSNMIKKQNGHKSEKSMTLIGCDSDFVTNWIENLWEENMSWDNYGWGNGKWNIEHTIPCEAFNLQDEKHQKICFNYTNLSPMWHEQNMEKSDWIIFNNKPIRARYLTKEQKYEYIESVCP